eukprot:3605612-Alexandrium_andersonii.AAC.1
MARSVIKLGCGPRSTRREAVGARPAAVLTTSSMGRWAGWAAAAGTTACSTGGATGPAGGTTGAAGATGTAAGAGKSASAGWRAAGAG